VCDNSLGFVEGAQLMEGHISGAPTGSGLNAGIIVHAQYGTRSSAIVCNPAMPPTFLNEGWVTA